MDLPFVCRPSVLGVLRVGLFLFCLLSGRGVQAEEPGAPVVVPSQPVEPTEYDRAIDAAVVEHDAGHFTEARAHFQRAHELSPSARTLRGLGMVEFELRNYGECVRYLESALASDERRLEGPLRQETEGLLARARAYVGEVHVAVDPGTARVMVDGVTVASGPEASFTLVVGDHELEFRAHGRLPEKRAVRIRGGEQTSLRVVLNPPDAEAERTAQVPARAPRERERLSRKWWLWTAVGVAVAGVAVGVGLLASRDEAVRERAVSSPNTPPGVVVMTLGGP